jgi:hypothetical protein
MQIHFVPNCHYYLPSHCATCGVRFMPDTLLATAYADSGRELGMVCDDCAQTGREQLRQRMLHYAATLRHRAEALQCLATEALCVTSHTAGKAYADWANKDTSGP